MNMRTELLETLVRQCVREVLDQIEEDAKVSTLKSSGVGKGDGKEPAKQKVPVKFIKGKKSKVNITKLNEAEDDKDDSEKSADTTATEPSAEPSPAVQPTAPPTDQPVAQPTAPPTAPAADAPEEPSEPPPPTQKGALVINPKDKSQLQPIKWLGKDEASIERTLHNVAVTTAGSRTKVSLIAKRLGRELANNPGVTAYFYFGKMDPESDEIFLLADKSMQIAKDDSIQPSDIVGTPVSTNIPVHHNYTAMTDDEYEHYRKKLQNRATPRYGGIDENALKVLKTAINKILSQ